MQNILDSVLQFGCSFRVQSWILTFSGQIYILISNAKQWDCPLLLATAW